MIKTKHTLLITLISIIVTFSTFSETNSNAILQEKYDYNIGDLVLTDETIIPYKTNCKFTKKQKNNAVAIIFKAGNKGSALGIGIKQPSALIWSYFSKIGYRTNFTSIQCTPIKNGKSSWGTWDNTKNWQGDTDGSDNWKQICDFFEKPEYALDKTEGQNISNYPAFEYVQNYTSKSAINLKNTSYESEWYLPSIAELEEIYENKTILNNVLKTLGDKNAQTLKEASYWSSSQYYASNSNAVILNFTTGQISNFGGDLKHYASNICTVHKF